MLAIVTIVTERYRTQYALIYTTRISEAVADKEIQLQERDAYNNPTVSMSTADMVRFARRVWNSPAKIRNVATKAHRMVMRLNNIYSVGDYFFIDFSIENKTNIRFETFEGNQRADHRADACPGIGTRQDVQARLPERDCREKDDLSERQAADHRNDGTTNQRAQYQPEH